MSNSTRSEVQLASLQDSVAWVKDMLSQSTCREVEGSATRGIFTMTV